MRRIATFAATLALSCTPSAAGPGGFGEGPGSTIDPPASTSSTTTTTAASSTTTTTTSTSTTDSESSSTSSSSTGSEPQPDLGPPGPEGCLGKIDFLFVISSSSTMGGHQGQLLAAFPSFYTAIQDHFPDFDTHILISDTDTYWSMGDCALCQDDCDPSGLLPECGAELTACDTVMGGGVTFPAGKESSARRCDLPDGRRFIRSDDPDPLGEFLCAAQLGSGGGVDRPAQAMVEGLSPGLIGPGGCNQGFLRDDALLVVTIIADGYDTTSKGWPPSWADALIEAKHGDDDAVLLLVITTDIDLPLHLSLCDGWDGEKNRLRLLVDEVPNSKIGSICAEDYGPFFNDAAAAIVELCTSFVPQ